MKNLILTISISLFIVNVYSQDVDSTITINKKKYYQLDQKLTAKQLNAILANNPASASEYQIWKKKSNIGLGFFGVGTGLACAGGVISFLGTIQQNQDINNGIIKSDYPSGLGLVVAGLGCAIVGAAIIIPARKKHLNQSINQYNSSLNKVGSRPVSFDLMVNSNGLGVRMRF